MIAFHTHYFCIILIPMHAFLTIPILRQHDLWRGVIFPADIPAPLAPMPKVPMVLLRAHPAVPYPIILFQFQDNCSLRVSDPLARLPLASDRPTPDPRILNRLNTTPITEFFVGFHSDCQRLFIRELTFHACPMATIITDHF
jgi:hypothetical protein